MNQPKQPNQDAQFPQHPYPYYPYHADDEVSLVDLAKILVRRKYVFFVTWALVILLSIAYMFYSKPKPSTTSSKDLVAFTTSIAIGYKTHTVFIEPMSAIQTLIQDAYLPSIQSEKGINLNIQVNYQTRRTISEDSSNILQLVTRASIESQAQVEVLHREVAAQLVERHQLIADQLLSQSKNINSDTGMLIVPSSLAKLAVPLNFDAKKASRANPKLILALGMVLGGMLGLISAFMAEFIDRVRKSLVEDSEVGK